jgi:hypothetical protein
VLRPEDFIEEEIAALEKMKAPESAKQFDSELRLRSKRPLPQRRAAP